MTKHAANFNFSPISFAAGAISRMTWNHHCNLFWNNIFRNQQLNCKAFPMLVLQLQCVELGVFCVHVLPTRFRDKSCEIRMPINIYIRSLTSEYAMDKRGNNCTNNEHRRETPRKQQDTLWTCCHSSLRRLILAQYHCSSWKQSTNRTTLLMYGTQMLAVVPNTLSAAKISCLRIPLVLWICKKRRIKLQGNKINFCMCFNIFFCFFLCNTKWIWLVVKGRNLYKTIKS